MFEGSWLADGGFVYLAEGAYGAVFVDRGRNRIRKVLYRKLGTDEAHCREVFKAELDALQIAKDRKELASLIAAPVTEIAGVRVLAADANDISSDFYTDLAFEAEFIDGAFVKIGAALASNDEFVRNQFRAAGIMHLMDASVIVHQGKIQKIIDIATYEVELRWTSLSS